MKPKLKINFSDFWPRFVKTDNFFWKLLSRKYDLEISEEPDILFYSHFGRNFLNYNCLRVMFQGENGRPDFHECDFAFSFDFIPDNPRNYRLPLYVMYDDVNKLTLPRDPDLIAKTKTKFCAFVVSNKFSAKRINFFKKLSKYKPVDSGGLIFNNVGGPVKNKLEFIQNYKFTLAFENSSYPGYTTEKIFEPMLVNSIPVYWGNPLIERDFNPASFLNYHEFENDHRFIEKIIEIDNNPDLYRDMLSQPFFHNNTINEFVNEENIIKQLDNIVNSIHAIEPVARIYKPKPKIRIYVKNKIFFAGVKVKYYLNLS
jgi:alpha(1,3/1,4) fucosyltransferase